MNRAIRVFAASILMALLVSPVWAEAPAPSLTPQLFKVTLGPGVKHAVSGRLLVFAIPASVAKAHANGKPVGKVDTSPFDPTQTAVAAMEVSHLASGGSVVVDADTMAYPQAFSALKPGDYDVQAVLDVNHNYNYSGRGQGDVIGKVVTVHLGGADAKCRSCRWTRPWVHACSRGRCLHACPKPSASSTSRSWMPRTHTPAKSIS